MDAKGWLIRMGWVVLCSTGLALASESEHSSEEEKHSEEAKHLDSGEDSNDLVLPLSVDLAPLYSALSQKVRDFAEGKSPADGKCQRHLTEILKAFLLNIPEEEPSTSDQEVLTLSTLRNEESRNRLNNAQRGELFPIAKKFKEKFSLEELHRMDIDFERFREINLLYSMPLERPLTSEEESLLNKATWALDPSPEQRIWNAIAAVEDGFKTPEEAFEILKSAVEEGNVDIISPYKPITYVNRSSFLRLAAELEENKGLEIARFLLDHGADANMSDDIEWAIHSALRHENIEIVRLLIDHGTSEEAKYLDSDGDSDVLPPSEDLAPLYSALSQKVRDFAEGKSPADGKYQRHLTESLKAFLLNTSEEVLSTSDQEVPAPSTLHNEESRNRLNNGQCGELFPIAKEFKEKFSSEELHQMDIDFERFREINLLCSLSPGRPHTSEEKSLLVKVISALDPSPEQRIRDAIDAVEDGAKTPEEALETIKSVVEEGNVDIISPYKPISYANRCSFLRLAAELEENKGLEIARFLLDHGADANMSDDIEQPLYTAVLYKNIEIARLLIEHGANVNPKTLCKEDNGWTPLHSAVYFEEFDIAELLLDHGADPSIQDDEGKTPLDIAMEEREKTDDETTQRQYDEILDKLRTQDA